MDFFARQDKARKKTKLLVFYFVVAVILIVVVNYLVALLVFAGVQSRQHHDDRYEQTPPLVLWNPQVFLGASFCSGLSTTNSSAAPKLNIPAMRLLGNTSRSVL